MYTEHSITKGFTAGVDISSSKLLGLYGRDIGVLVIESRYYCFATHRCELLLLSTEP